DEPGLQADGRGARPACPRPQPRRRRGGRLRVLRHLRPLLPLAGGAGPCLLRLVRPRRHGPGDQPHRADDRRHLPDHALPPSDHRPGRRHTRHPERGPLHPRARRRRAAERARRRRRLARRRRAPCPHGRGAGDHPGAPHRRAEQLPRPLPAARPCKAVRPAAAQAAGHLRLRRARGLPPRRPQGRWADRHRAEAGACRGLPQGRRHRPLLCRDLALLRPERGGGAEDRPSLCPLVGDGLEGDGGTADHRGLRRRHRTCCTGDDGRPGSHRARATALPRADRDIPQGRLRPPDPEPDRPGSGGLHRLLPPRPGACPAL
ncbi:MAG: Glucose-6-phosphate dehydrogenase (coenzyme F420), partial [uncultured Craurococcus sp.]